MYSLRDLKSPNIPLPQARVPNYGANFSKFHGTFVKYKVEVALEDWYPSLQGKKLSSRLSLVKRSEMNIYQKTHIMLTFIRQQQKFHNVISFLVAVYRFIKSTSHHQINITNFLIREIEKNLIGIS